MPGAALPCGVGSRAQGFSSGSGVRQLGLNPAPDPDYVTLGNIHNLFVPFPPSINRDSESTYLPA